ncbi:MAG: methionyl-tRNA formyltransferase [Actinobacteria bacterium]|uniref:methionyl-tRNA formyltransferase n=1 Tax=freshwater metagenome TaxID=449393 RepID=A0A6J7GXS9_9ZZZZ|nr:methionyl-tRNA formyltransferase [Actinomycetota bacterium]MSX24530.1 methionyl-tRNA formyltransferase [Actinomycetota bacterium]MSY46827.1 methionyl-tRNA formyltransferase [Actinomycetota bacterium]MTB00214.1 methionyl-tRNA formyltransferase [Actinomycetota bacterium]
MRIAVAATPAIAIPTLEALLTSGHHIAIVVTQPGKPAGRGLSARKSPVALWAQEKGIVCIEPLSVSELVEPFKEIDLVVTLAYGVLIPLEILTIPKFGFLNIHFSLLPAWRGAAPVQRAILNGDKVSGISIFKLDPGMDTGPVYLRREYALDSKMNAEEVLAELSLLAPSALLETIDMVSAGVEPIAQSTSGVSLAPKVRKNEARIDWSKSAQEIDRLVRAFTPNPGAWSMWRQWPIVITRAQEVSFDGSLAQGRLEVVDRKLYVGTGSGALQILSLLPAGKRNLSSADWVNGARLIDGDCFV